MRTIAVYHPKIAALSTSPTQFTGATVNYSVTKDGDLMISNWETPTEKGWATFARGQWLYVSRSDEKKSIHK